MAFSDKEIISPPVTIRVPLLLIALAETSPDVLVFFIVPPFIIVVPMFAMTLAGELPPFVVEKVPPLIIR
ncbi:MAG: hypothetical protein IJT90_09410 [Bacteroidaceae bacterium]|nr:hypothetical protein [Bacteroidaceae bacterium]